ncbi:heterokaryon incompatibility protein-domain-containing protein [Aspergillus ambiguus]|uniref:heterokaryon incompatibility protein-domain-containing protein n=1 Tax=Aspergillus ambiguus TaxID=176160 RepID=UPI003CCDFC66
MHTYMQRQSQARMKTFKVINILDWTVNTFEIGKSPPYLAISHAWSDKIFPTRLPLDSSFGGNAIKQTILKRNLDSVRFCWVDLFCIQQDSEEDVHKQIPLMGQIFRDAEAVLIILTDKLNLTQEQIDYGTSQLEEALTIWETETWTDDGVRQYWAFGEGRTKLVQAMGILSRFTKAAWGTRIWTLQEYLLATNVLWIGSDLEPLSIDDELFVAIPGLCEQLDITECVTRGGSTNSDYSLLYSHFSGMAASRVNAIERTRVMELLGNRQASVPVDEVYGIMAATTVEISVRPKESRESAWKRWLEAALTAGHLRWLMIPPTILPGNVGGVTCEGVLFSKRHDLSSASGLDAVTPYGPVAVSEGTVSLSARLIGPCTILRKLGRVNRSEMEWVHRDISLIVYSKGDWSSAIDVAVAFGSGRYSNVQLILIAQVLTYNFGRALRYIQQHTEHRFYPILQSDLAGVIWANFMQLLSRSVMDTMNFGVGYLVRVRCPTTQVSFLTVLVTNGRRPEGSLMAFDCNARAADRRHTLLIGEMPAGEVQEQARISSLPWHKAGVTIPVSEDYAFGWDKIPLRKINVGGSRCQICQRSGSAVIAQASYSARPRRDCATVIRSVWRRRYTSKVLQKFTRKVNGISLDVRSLNRSRRHEMLLREWRLIM